MAAPLAFAIVAGAAMTGCETVDSAVQSVNTGIQDMSAKVHTALNPDDAQKPDDAAGRKLAPGDFHANSDERTARERVVYGEPTETASTTTTGADAKTDAPAASAPDDAIVVDAMVGQVTGRPVYASAVFAGIGTEQLERLGQTLPRLTFKERVTKLIVGKLREQITNSLILAEAEAGLTEQMQVGVLQFLEGQRKLILSEFQGSLDLANKHYMKTKGITVAQEIEERRQRALVDRYLSQKLYPKISVSRREVKRYYDDHPEDYAASLQVALQIILVKDADKADKVDSALDAGRPFEEVADELSDRGKGRSKMGPYTMEKPLNEFDQLAWPAMNAQVQSLREGEHGPRINVGSDTDPIFAWVYVEKLVGGEAKTLEEVQIEIEKKIRATKFATLSRRYTDELWEKGNYTPIDDMLVTLVDVAMARFARPL